MVLFLTNVSSHLEHRFLLQGGILTGKSCGTSIDHAILVVGYNMTVRKEETLNVS